MAMLEQSADLCFHSVEYSLYSSVHKQTLIVEAEQKSNGHRWSAEFSASYIEDMTRKTGNFKKFSVFVNMLWSALKGNTDAVFVDLLTYRDLEALKNRRSIHASPRSLAATATASEATSAASHAKHVHNSKRYLILTYAVEFDRVHYPLPLCLNQEPDHAAMQRTVDRLRRELELLRSHKHDDTEARTSTAQMQQLQDENKKLKAVVRRLQTDSEDRIEERHEQSRELEAELHAVREDLQKKEELLRESERENERLRQSVSSEKLLSIRLKRELTAAKKKSSGSSHIAAVHSSSASERSTFSFRRRGRSRSNSRKSPSRASRLRQSSPRTSPAPSRNSDLSIRRTRSGSALGAARIGRSRSPRVIAASSGAAGTRRSGSRSGSVASSRSPRSSARFDPTEYIRNKAKKDASRRRQSPGTWGRPNDTPSKINRRTRARSLSLRRSSNDSDSNSNANTDTLSITQATSRETKPPSRDRTHHTNQSSRRKASASIRSSSTRITDDSAPATGTAASSSSWFASSRLHGSGESRSEQGKYSHEGRSKAMHVLRSRSRSSRHTKDSDTDSPNTSFEAKHNHEHRHKHKQPDQKASSLTSKQHSATTSEIRDLDQRLSALQSFLKAAKAVPRDRADM